MNAYGSRATPRSFLVNADKAQKEFNRAGYRSKDALKHMDRATKLEKAAAAYLTTSEPSRAEGLAVTLHRLYPHLNIYVRVNTLREQDKLVSGRIKRRERATSRARWYVGLCF